MIATKIKGTLHYIVSVENPFYKSTERLGEDCAYLNGMSADDLVSLHDARCKDK